MCSTLVFYIVFDFIFYILPHLYISSTISFTSVHSALQIKFMKGSGGGVTFSGGEPLMQVEQCIAIAKIIKSRGLSVAVDTSGYVKREVIDQIIPYTDTFLFDIKAIDN